jgi:hypothetical protein
MKIRMKKRLTRPARKHLSGHITPADGNIFLDLGFPPDEAEAMLAEANREIEEERRIKQIARESQKRGDI